MNGEKELEFRDTFLKNNTMQTIEHIPVSELEKTIHSLQLSPTAHITLTIEENDDEQWKKFSLANAMRGLESDEFPDYTEADFKEKWK